MDNQLNVNYNQDEDRYSEFEDNLKEFFNKAVSDGKRLFKTNSGDLFETYLNNLPKEAQEHYSCNACRHFINRFGGLVTIEETGEMKSVMWNPENAPPFFAHAVLELREKVLNSQVISVFISDTAVIGHPKTGEWTHLSVTVPSSLVNQSRLHTASQVMAEKREDFKMLVNALNVYSYTTVEKALALLQSETLYRSERLLGVAEWFKNIMEDHHSIISSNGKRNALWLAVATAPNGFTHIKSSMVGTLLDDIQEGLSTEIVSRRFAEKMNPSNYMRSQSAPSTNAIFEAEKTVEKLGIANSLKRRYARYEEIQSFLWEQKKDKPSLPSLLSEKRSGVFGHLAPKEDNLGSMNIPTKVMTWRKFMDTVLPTADSIEAMVDNPNRLMAMVTAVHEDAPNILQWDNTFSWYYHGGIDGEIKRRVEEAGGKYDDNEIRVSLIWEGLTDLDLHCTTPRGELISYSHKRGRCGGYLDLDMNGIDKNSQTPVENMRWVNAPEGSYKFAVHNFAERVNGRMGTPFRVELEVDGKVYHYEGKPLISRDKITVFEFNYVKGQQPAIAHSSRSSSSNEAWNVQNNSFVKVNGITTSPNLWGENPMGQSGRHVFFLLDGIKDESEGKGRGFFNETLKSDLRPIRKTLELFTANTPIEGSYDATACGVGYSVDNEWDLTLKVTAGSSTRHIKIDRVD